jgi:hypothetical protein
MISTTEEKHDGSEKKHLIMSAIKLKLKKQYAVVEATLAELKDFGSSVWVCRTHSYHQGFNARLSYNFIKKAIQFVP